MLRGRGQFGPGFSPNSNGPMSGAPLIALRCESGQLLGIDVPAFIAGLPD